MEDIRIYVAHGYDSNKAYDKPNASVGVDLFTNLCCADMSKNTNGDFKSCCDKDNIADKFIMYRELTALYWVWKNAPETEWIGFCLEDQYLSLANTKETLAHEMYLDDITKQKHCIQQNVIADYLNDKDAVFPVATEVTNVHPSYGMLSHYVDYCKNEFDTSDNELFRKALAAKSPDFVKYLNGSLAAVRIIKSQCFILRKKYFTEYCEWLFGILFELEKQICNTDYSLLKKGELFRYARIMLNMYSMYLEQVGGCRASRLPLVVISNISDDSPPAPAFPDKNVPVLLTSSNYYVPYTATAICSLLKNTSDNYNYDIILLERDITNQNKQILLRMTDEYKNVKLRFYNVNRHAYTYEENISRNVKYRFLIEVYFRLFALYTLKSYSKIVWLDSDLVVLNDVGKLFDIDLNGNTCGFVRDLLGYSNFETGCHDDRFMHFYKNVYKLKSLYNYFNAGVGIIDCQKFRETISLDHIMTLAKDDRYLIKDQDILCELLEGQVEFIPDRWNIVSVMTDENLDRFFLNEQDKLRFVDERNNACIVHYAAGEKPWHPAYYDRYELFWSYARLTPFYEEILRRMFSAEFSIPSVVPPETTKNKPFLRRVFDRWFPVGSKRRDFVKRMLFA